MLLQQGNLEVSSICHCELRQLASEFIPVFFALSFEHPLVEALVVTELLGPQDLPRKCFEGTRSIHGIVITHSAWFTLVYGEDDFASHCVACNRKNIGI